MMCIWPRDMYDKLPARAYNDIESAMGYGYGERHLVDVLLELERGEKQLWMHSTDDDFKATIITQIIDLPAKRRCEVVYLGGLDMLEYVGEVSAIEDWARDNGCDDIQAIGRPGWERALKPLGYTRRYITVGRDL